VKVNTPEIGIEKTQPRDLKIRKNNESPGDKSDVNYTKYLLTQFKKKGDQGYPKGRSPMRNISRRRATNFTQLK
jgi:hypothetical protein